MRKCLSKENETDKETEKARELARMLAELIAYYQKQPAPPVEASVDVETVLDKQTIERLVEMVLDEKTAIFSAQLLQIFTSNYSTKLGQGGYGEVFKGHFPDGRPIAVKLLHSHGIDKRIEEQFMAETKALVYEYMENGSVDKLLFENKHEIEWDKLYEIAVGAATGLEYLHHFSLKKIIHYDIKPANVLLDSNFCPKIADFGLAKLCNRESTNITMSRVGGTPGYAAPEIWMPFPVSYKCDAYSFLVMLFEIIGRRRNFVENNREKAKTMVSGALWCVQYLPEARPSMRNVVKVLEGGAEAATLPNPSQHLISSANVHSIIRSTSNPTTILTKMIEMTRQS
ncbi:putative S-locus lectin protein kinase family protein [Hibiscus syriacus]|uniref:non-specific serine/threonine protein kinase n=1 Tax=Hibiscus syriacus TaxID=106335 RepID=A0A6A2YLW4_HIBSY|nr:putative S-locus lectin protein kinase family protein [Hibiscus syriacus]